MRIYALIGVVATLAAPAAAYETDQLTGRDQILTDAVHLANALMRDTVEAAVRDTNARTRCAASPRRTQRMFARTLYRLSSQHATVPERGGLRVLGFEAISASLESDADALRFKDRSDIYGGVRFGESAILATVGTASTVAIRGHRIGTDKLDHFAHFGFVQWRRSNFGAQPEKGRRWGIRTERTFFGLYTSKSFSFADLAANDAGAAFYDNLFGESGPVRLDAGCVQHSDRPFDWGDHITADWDEVLNPSVHSPRVAAKIRSFIAADADGYCAIYREQLKGEAYDRTLAERFAVTPAYADHPRVPARTEPFGLRELCSAE